MKWWDLATGGVLAAMGVSLFMTTPEAGTMAVGFAALAGILASYLVFGRSLLARADTDEQQPRLAIVFLTCVGVFAAVGVAAEPNLASLQTVLYPMLWTLSPRYSRAVLGSALLATVIGVGLWVGLNGVGSDGPGAVSIAFGIQALSFAFSVALGTWITRIADEGAAARALVTQLRLAQADIAELSSAAGAAAERERLSRELHDTLTQTLTGLVMLAERAGSELRGTLPEASATHSIELIERTARDALDEARALVARSHPLGDQGLAESLTRVAARAQDETGTVITMTATDRALPREIEVVLLRCAQEGLANVRNHAHAATARLTLTADHDSATLRLLDDGVGPGVGLDATVPGPRSDSGFGLAGMRERVAQVGGRMTFGSAPAGGALLEVCLPLTRNTSLDRSAP